MAVLTDNLNTTRSSPQRSYQPRHRRKVAPGVPEAEPTATETRKSVRSKPDGSLISVVLERGDGVVFDEGDCLIDY